MTGDSFEQLHRDLLAERFQPHREYRASACEMAAREAMAALSTGRPQEGHRASWRPPTGSETVEAHRTRGETA